MGCCKANHFTTNIMVTHSAFVCFGGFGQTPCQYLQECMKEYNMKFRKK